MLENRVDCYEFGDYRLDIANRELFRSGSPVSLTQKSFETLKFLIENRGRILKKVEFLDSLWEGSFVEEANLTQHIYMLRKALKQNSDEVYIETIPKNGYRFVAEVKEVLSESVGIGFAQNGLAGGSSNGVYSEIAEDEILFEEEISPDSYETKVVGRNPIENPESTNVSQSQHSSFSLLTASIAALFAVTAIIGLFYFAKDLRASTGVDIGNKSIAVLPFKQIGAEKDAKMGVGIADVLIARLANIGAIDVRPTTSILRFAGEDNSDLFEVGRKLGVDCVIEGTVQRDKDIVRVTAQLYDVKEGRQIWTEKFDEKYSDIFTLQDKVSERITAKLSAAGSPFHEAALPYKQYTKSPDAYRAYSMGLSYWSMHDQNGFLNAIRQFEKAIEKDSQFAIAYAYLADTYAHTGHMRELMTDKQARAKGAEAAKKALEIDPDNAVAMAALALIYANEDRRGEAFDLMTRSVSNKPNDAHARHRISWMYANKGMLGKAVSEMKIAQKLDPQSAYINLFLGEMLLLARQPDESIVFLNKAREIEPTSFSASRRLIEAYEQKGQFGKAEKELNLLLKKASRTPSVLLLASRIYAKTDKKKKAQTILDKVVSNPAWAKGNRKLIAYAQIALGNKEEALKGIETVINGINDNIYTIKYDPLLDPIRGNASFAKILNEKEAAQNW